MWQIKFDEKERKWANVSIPRLYHESASIGFVAITELAKCPDRVIQINDNNDVTMTASEMRSKIIRAAVHLERHNLEQGDVIGVVARNNHNLAPIVIGGLLNGCAINALDVAFSQDDIQHMFNITRPKIILCDYDQHEKVINVNSAIKLAATIITFDKRVSGCDYIDDYLIELEPYKEIFYVPISLKDGDRQTAFIVCSSGTTGYHKGICLSHGHLIKKMLSRATTPEIKLYCSSSLYWMTGVDYLLTSILGCLTRVITTDPFTAENFFKLVKTYKINHVLIPPSYVAMIVKSPELKTADLSSIKFLSATGSALPQSYYDEIQKYLPVGGLVIPAYGMTEVGGVCSVNITHGCFGSVGLLYTDIEARIVDEVGQLLGPNETGEVVLRDANFTFLGYKNDSEATKAVFDKDGWIRSGDLGYFDDSAMLYITDRKKEILKYQNYHISPTELEEIIMNFGGIKLAGVVGVPDKTSTDLPAALIVKDNKSFNEIRFNEYIEGKLSDYKKLRGGIYYVDSLPLTVNGKLKRKEAQEIAVKLYKFNNL